MPYLFLLGAMCSSCAMNLCGTAFNQKQAHREGVFHLYNVLLTASAFVGWVLLYAVDFSFAWGVLPYAVGFAACYTMAILGSIRALATGSVALTAFVKQVSMVLVSVWGLVFWNAALTAKVVVGLLLVLAALVLCLFRKNRLVVTREWFGHAIVLLVGTAGCSIFQKYQQQVFDGKHGTMLMVFASLFSFGICLILALRSGKGEWLPACKTAWVFPIGSGCASFLLNLFVLWMTVTTLSPSVIYPGIAIGGLTLTTLLSVWLFRDKLTVRQWVGLAVGAVALVFLNLS